MSPKKSRGARSGRKKLLTLTEVSERSGISLPTLMRYKKKYQSRIPSEGSGRTQRYPLEALPVFEKLKQENLARRGRPRGSGGSSSKGGLISLAEIGRRTGISYPTLLRYQKLHGDQIPSVGTGRKRRYPEKAVAVFQRLRSRSRAGRKPGGSAAGSSAALDRRVRSLEKSVRDVERSLQKLTKLLQKPVTVTLKR